MKNRKFLVMALIVLPLIVVFIASGASSVMVFDGENTAYYSWMQPVNKSYVGWCAPVALLLNYILFPLAIFYGLKKKQWCICWIRNIAAVAGCLAVLPNMIRADIMVIPNVFGAIGLFADAVAAHFLLDMDYKKPKSVSSGQRLKQRK